MRKGPKLVEAFRKLENLWLGHYVRGRHGHPSRFQWWFTPVSIRQAAARQDQQRQAKKKRKRRNHYNRISTQGQAGATVSNPVKSAPTALQIPVPQTRTEVLSKPPDNRPETAQDEPKPVPAGVYPASACIASYVARGYRVAE